MFQYNQCMGCNPVKQNGVKVCFVLWPTVKSLWHLYLLSHAGKVCGARCPVLSENQCAGDALSECRMTVIAHSTNTAVNSIDTHAKILASCRKSIDVTGPDTPTPAGSRSHTVH